MELPRLAKSTSYLILIPKRIYLGPDFNLPDAHPCQYNRQVSRPFPLTHCSVAYPVPWTVKVTKFYDLALAIG